MKRPGAEGLEEDFRKEAPLFLGNLMFMGKIEINHTSTQPIIAPPVLSQYMSFNMPTQSTFSQLGNLTEAPQARSFSADDKIFPEQVCGVPARADPAPLLEGERLYVLRSQTQNYCITRKQSDGLQVSLDDILLKKMFLRLSTIEDLIELQYYVQMRIQVPEAISKEFVNIRIECYLNKSVFDEKFNQLTKNLQQQIAAVRIQKRHDKKKGGEGVTERLRRQTKEIAKLNRTLSTQTTNRQLIMLLLNILAVPVKVPALVKPDITRNESSLFLISNGFVSDRTQLKVLMSKFDKYCAKTHARMFGRLLSNLKELNNFRDGNGSFSRVVCTPHLKRFLSEQELKETSLFEELLLKPTRSRYPVLGEFLLDYLTHDNLTRELKQLESRQDQRETFYNLRGQLRKEFKEEDKKLDKQLRLNVRMMVSENGGQAIETCVYRPERRTKKTRPKIINQVPEEEATLAELYGVDNPKNFLLLAEMRRNMIKLLTRRNNVQTFEQFEEELKNIRDHEQPRSISTELMPHQQQALTWMKYRECRISSRFVMQQDYSKKSIEIERELGAYWEELELIDGTRIYTNNFTGGFSMQPVRCKPVSGGILAFEMGLGKTVTSLAMMLEPNPFAVKLSQGLQARNLFVTIPSMVPDEIVILLRKHVRPPLSYYIYDRNTRKQNVDLRKYDIVVASYRTVTSDYNSLTEDGRLKLQQQLHSSSLFSEEDFANLQFIEPDIDFEAEPVASNKHDSQNTDPNNSFQNLFSYNWERIVIDEAHHIRNRKTAVSEAVTNLQGEHRWCLTGSPILNHKTELFALCKFLRVDLFSEWKWWNQYLKRSRTMEEGFDILHKVMRPILFHKSKHSLDRFGRPIVNLPLRQNNVIEVPFDAKERKAYIALETACRNFIKLAMNDNFKQTNETKQKIRPFTLLLRLRQFCVNPFLALQSFDKAQEEITMDEAKRFFEMSLQDILAENEFAKCIECQEEDEDLEEMKCGHMICSDCLERSDEMIDPSHYDCKNCIDRKPRTEMEAEEEANEEKKVIVSNFFGSKLKRIVELAEEILSRGEKCIIFTMWIHIMEQLALRLNEKGFSAVAVHSRIKKDAKGMILERFKNQDAQVLVTSLRSCGEGLNLVEANNVIIVEPEWNPAIEEQGIDRVYRIGQNRMVRVYRVVVINSIEEKLRQLHEKKTHETQYALMNKDFFKKKKYYKSITTLLLGGE